MTDDSKLQPRAKVKLGETKYSGLTWLYTRHGQTPDTQPDPQEWQFRIDAEYFGLELEAYALAYSASLREEIERLHKDSIARSDANTTLYQQVRAAEGRVKALEPFTQHSPDCYTFENRQMRIMKHWQEQDVKWCDCGLAAALGKKP